MTQKSIAEKLHIREGHKLLLLNAPRGYTGRLGRLPKNVSIVSQPTEIADIVRVFVRDREQLKEQLPRLASLVKQKGILWVSYPKGTSKMKTEINRDTIQAYAHKIGMEAVAIFSVNDDWSARKLKIAK